MSATVKCTCISTASGWDETKCAYHKAKKPFIRFRMLIGSNTHMCPQAGQIFTLGRYGISQVGTKRA